MSSVKEDNGLIRYLDARYISSSEIGVRGMARLKWYLEYIKANVNRDVPPNQFTNFAEAFPDTFKVQYSSLLGHQPWLDINEELRHGEPIFIEEHNTISLARFFEINEEITEAIFAGAPIRIGKLWLRSCEEGITNADWITRTEQILSTLKDIENPWHIQDYN